MTGHDYTHARVTRLIGHGQQVTRANHVNHRGFWPYLRDMGAEHANSALVTYQVGGQATVGWSPMLHLRPSRSHRPDPPPVPPGVWAEPPAGPYSLILSDPKRMWGGIRDLGRVPRVWNACIRGDNIPRFQQPLSREAGMLSLTWLP